MSIYKKLKEDVPAVSAGAGNIAGIGVGPQGEPGVNMAIRRKKWKKDKQQSISTRPQMHVPMDMISGGMVAESFKPLDVELWTTAQVLAKSEYPQHPTPESTKFAIAWYIEHGGEVASNVAKNEAISPVEEDLRNWFGTGKTGGIGGGGWDRYNTKGERIGKCGDAEDRGGAGEGKPKCLSKEKLTQLRAQGGKQAIANAVKRKKTQDPVTNRKGTGNAPRPVSNRIGESVLVEKNVPTNPQLWSRAKAEAKKRFDVYPSAYANGWAAKWYKKKGGGWKRERNEASSPAQQAAIAIAMKKAGKTPTNERNTPADREWGTNSLTNIYKKDTPGQLEELFAQFLSLSEATKTTSHVYTKWADPRTEPGLKNLRQEYHVEYELKLLSVMLDDVWPTFDDFLQSVKNAKIIEVTPSIDNRIDGRSQTQSKQELLQLLKTYQSWGTFRTPKTLDNLYDRLTNNQPMMMPIIIQLPNSGMRIMSGNTRMDVAFQLGITPKALLVSVPTQVEESEYQGRKVKLGKPIRTPGGPKKFSVYVKNDKDNVVKVNFGDPNMEIKRDDPKRRKAYRDRHNCDNPGPRWKANYWSCRMWSAKPVSKITEDAPPLDKPTMEPEEIAKKHKVSVQDIEDQLTLGIKVEQEHTSNIELARQIALDHLAELPDYYTRLASMEM